MATPPFQFEAIAEDALLLRFGNRIALALNALVLEVAARLQKALPQIECIPAYASILLRFDPCDWNDSAGGLPHAALQAAVSAVLDTPSGEFPSIKEHCIPVCYGGEYGPDLTEVAVHSGCGADEVIARHVAGAYRVAMLGFAPGFPYLLGLDPRLAMPRRGDPRQRVPAGSVAIGGDQTGIYPQELPGGWQLIGRTPLALFDVSAPSPSLLAPGDRVRFQAIGEAEFRQRAAARP